MKHLLASLVLGISLVGAAAAQAPQYLTAKGAQSDKIVIKIRQVDVLIQILPLNLKKEQIKAILTAQEKAKEKERQIRSLEDDELEKLDVKLSKVLKDGFEKGAYPPREFQVEVAKLTAAMSLRRQVALGEMIDDFYTATQNVFEPGQKTVMEKSLDVAKLDRSIKVDQMDSTQKIKFFIRQIFMDSTSYESLKELLKTAP